MFITIKKQSPFSLREQIKRQIRMLIESRELKMGQSLPSARDLSAVLKVNRNTVTQAYKELASEGILEIVTGSGTFVKKGLTLSSKKALDREFDKAVQKARQCGFSTCEITEHFLNRLFSLLAKPIKKRVLVVDCNNEVINYLCNTLSDEFGVSAEGVLIQELEKNKDSALAYFQNKDLVVCGFNHHEELKEAVPNHNVEIVYVLFKIDAKVINILSQLPDGIKIGYVCANQRSTETFYNNAYFSGGKRLGRILAGCDNSNALKKVIKSCDVIFATNIVYNRIKKMTRPGQRLVNINIALDPSSMDIIRERLCRQND